MFTKGDKRQCIRRASGVTAAAVIATGTIFGSASAAVAHTDPALTSATTTAPSQGSSDDQA